MATLRTYSASFEQNALSSAAVTRYRFNEGTGTDAEDSIDGLDGDYRSGAAPGAAGSIGDGAASFNGSTGFVLVETLSGTITVSAFGDSEIAGIYGMTGLDPDDRFSPNLATALEGRGLTADVINRGVSGETSGDALARTDDVVDDEPDVVILEFGTNDALQTIDPDDVEDNLREIIDDLQGGGVTQILLAGAFGYYPDRPSGTKGYASETDRADLEDNYADIAGDTSGVVLLDADGSQMFLGGERTGTTIDGGVLDSSDMSLSFGDGLHPNADGVEYIVERVLPQTIALGAAAGAVNEPLLLSNGAFEMWFSVDDLDQTQTLFAKDSEGLGTGGQVDASVNTNGRLTFALSDDSGAHSVRSADGAVDAGTPTHLVATFGSGGMELFINGAEVDTDAYTGGLDAGLGNFEQLVIGAGNGSSTPGTIDGVDRFFDGTIDEFAVYDRALTDDEIEQLFDGGELGTSLVGTAAADQLIGGSDDEELGGAGGDDTIDGNDGNDELRGGGGQDLLRGGKGDDQLIGGRDADELRGGAGADVLDGKKGNDVLAGGGGDDLLEGRADNDRLSGAGGSDELYGNKGTDVLLGGGGNDLLNGGNGKDELTGGSGSDTYQISKIKHGVDKIFGFQDGSGGDILDLSEVINFNTGNDVDDFVRLDQTNGNTKVEVDPNGGGNSFSAVFNLIGVTGLDIANLVDDGNLDLGAPTS